MIDEEEIKRYKRLDKELANATLKIPFLVNPTNLEKEHQKFFSMNDYNPQFRYRSLVKSLEPVKQELEALEIKESTFDRLVKEKRDLLIQKIDMMNDMGTPEFTKQSIKIFGKPDRQLLVRARKILNAPVVSSHEYISVEQSMREVRKILKRRGLKWVVKKKSMLARAAVRSKHRTMFLKEDAKFSPKIINRLIIHEIGTHIFRAQNGIEQPYKLFSQGLPNYLMTEEGLAVVNEEVQGVLDQRILKIYAARTLAVSMALNRSFNEVYHFLIKYLPPATAWRITARVKRGLKDTKEPGGFTKDHLYFKGYLEVKRYLQRKGDIVKLYYGKIGLEHVDILDEIPGLIEPKFLPIFRKNELKDEY